MTLEELKQVHINELGELSNKLRLYLREVDTIKNRICELDAILATLKVVEEKSGNTTPPKNST